MDNDVRVAIITGAAGGIGSAMAFKYAENGYSLTLVDNNTVGLNELDNVLQNSNANTLCLGGNLEQTRFLRHIIEASIERWGHINVLINNAAWRTLETMRTISVENWNKTIKICLTAPAFLSKYAAESMENNCTEGVIINVSSIMANRTSGISPAYSACKGALESLTYELAVLYGPKKIRVVGISPGNIQTDLSSDYKDEQEQNISKELISHMNAQTPLLREGSASEIADIAYWLSTPQASFVNGTLIVADGGFTHNFNSYQIKKIQLPSEF